MDPTGQQPPALEYQQFLRHLSQRSNERHVISHLIETLKWQEKLFKLLRARDKESKDTVQAYEKLLEQIEPRIAELQLLNPKIQLKGLLPELLSKYEKNQMSEIDSLISRQKLHLHHKSFADTLPTEPEELAKRYLEAAPKLLENPAKLEILQGLAIFLRKGPAEDKLFSSNQSQPLLESLEDKMDNAEFKRENRPPIPEEIETMLNQLVQENTGMLEYTFDSANSTFSVVLRIEANGEVLRVKLVPESDSVVPEDSERLREAVDAINKPGKGIRNVLMELVIACKAGRLQDHH
jgi:hypothetical protein